MAMVPWRGKHREREPGRGESSPLTVLRQEMDRLFDQYLREPLSSLEWPFGARGWAPAIDVAESEQEVTVRAELPGVEPGDLDISITGNQLVISGEKKEASERSGKDFHVSETRYGAFRRAVPLPADVDAENVEAAFANGVLTIRLKKVQAAGAKRIEVKVK
jgi:HSP20 family protein